jgi:ketosteroid isomerase-like protein
MTTLKNRTTSESDIRTLIEQRVNAVDHKDLSALLSHHSPDVLSFDVVNPLQYAGVARVNERAEHWLASFQGSIGYEVRDLKIMAGDDVAFCHFLYHVSGTLIAGSAVSMWVRATLCLHHVNGEWMIAHEHQSVPFDAVTGQASLNLVP